MLSKRVRKGSFIVLVSFVKVTNENTNKVNTITVFFCEKNVEHRPNATFLLAYAHN